MLRIAALAAFVLFAALQGALAHDFKAGALTIDHPYGPDTPPNARTAVAYLKIVNDGDAPDRLLGASSSRSDAVELHTTIREGDIARMRPVEAVEIPARGSVTFGPGGLHIMLVGLRAPFVTGQTVPLTLTFEKAGAVAVGVLVERPGRGAPDAGAHQH